MGLLTTQLFSSNFDQNKSNQKISSILKFYLNQSTRFGKIMNIIVLDWTEGC